MGKRMRFRDRLYQETMKRAVRWIAPREVPLTSTQRELIDMATKQRDNALDELCRIRGELEANSELNCFRVAIAKMPFGRMGGDIYAVKVEFDPRMIEYGTFLHTNIRGCFDTVNLSQHIRWLTMELTRTVEQAIYKQLVTDKVMPAGATP